MKELKFTQFDVLLREIPGEVCLAFNISQCPYHCKGCHSVELWGDNGETLTYENMDKIIDKYKNGITCILFMGDAGDIKNVFPYAQHIKSRYGLKTAVYTGQTDAQLKISMHEWGKFDLVLDYVKVGPWREDCGTLNSNTTNQALYKISIEKVVIK